MNSYKKAYDSRQPLMI